MTNKDAALASIDRALAEAAHPACSLLAIGAFLNDAKAKVGAIQELVRPRRAAKAATSAGAAE